MFTEATQRTCIGTGEMTRIAFIVVLVPWESLSSPATSVYTPHRRVNVAHREMALDTAPTIS